MATAETVPIFAPNPSSATEAEYDATVRADIELFRSYAEKYMAGEITDDQFRAQRLRRGVYSQRQAGVQMIRTKIPGGSADRRANGSARGYRRRVRRRQRTPDHPPEHAVSLRSVGAGSRPAAPSRPMSG